MSWFQRKRGTSADDATVESQDVEGADVEGTDVENSGVENSGVGGTGGVDEAGTSPRSEGSEEVEERRRAEGPHDESEAEGAAARIDLGALRLPARQGMELRLEMEEKTKRVIAVAVTVDGSSLQLQVFAAPRRDGLWDDIRADIATQVTKQGGTADEVPGVFGREILARLPVRTKDGRSGHRPSRFVGMDGPRWFLRGVFTGPAAVDEDAATALEEVFRGVVVVRGTEAMAPRDLLALKLPAGAQVKAPGAAGAEGGAAGPGAGAEPGAGAAAADGGEPERDPLKPFERGPEITERR